MVVEEFASVIGVEAEEGERERLFDVADLLEDPGFSFPPDGSLFRPAGGDVRAVEGVGEQAQKGVAAVGDGIRFEETGARFVPLFEFNGDLVA